MHIAAIAVPIGKVTKFHMVWTQNIIFKAMLLLVSPLYAPYENMAQSNVIVMKIIENILMASSDSGHFPFGNETAK